MSKYKAGQMLKLKAINNIGKKFDIDAIAIITKITNFIHIKIISGKLCEGLTEEDMFQPESPFEKNYVTILESNPETVKILYGDFE